MANRLDIMKRVKFTSVTSNRQEEIHIMIDTVYVGNCIKYWHVTEEVSCSDHRYICFTVKGIGRSVEVYRNPRRNDWESFRTERLGCLSDMTDKKSNSAGLENAANQYQDAIVLAYNEKCPIAVRNISWRNQDLAERRKKVHRLLNLANKSGNWTDYKRNFTVYNKALRQAKKESWRGDSEEIEKDPECARLHSILSKDGSSAVSFIQFENEEYTTSERWILEELFRVHLHGSEIITEPSGGWDGIELGLPKWKGSREAWASSKRLFNYE